LFAKCILCKFYDAAESLKLLAAGFGENFIWTHEPEWT
jgi:hypothetical protein